MHFVRSGLYNFYIKVIVLASNTALTARSRRFGMPPKLVLHTDGHGSEEV